MRLPDSQLGDAYQDKKRASVIHRLGDHHWGDQSQQGSYLAYVKTLTPRWPQLELLADFMEVGTVPTRWCIFPGEEEDKNAASRYVYPAPIEERKNEQNRRAHKMNVALIEYNSTDTPQLKRFQYDAGNLVPGADELQKAIALANEKERDVTFSLFVVEDLSRDVIEMLGSGFDIDPMFFRSHIAEYVWNNIRDRWREPPLLEIDAHQREWFQMRLVRSRYFSNEGELHEAKKCVDDFNVLRRMDADQNQIFWDKDPRPSVRKRFKEHILHWINPADPIDPHEERVNAKVGHIRSRATFWLRPRNEGLPAVGVLLLEPTPQVGYSLWRGYANWDQVPKYSSQVTRQDDAEIPPSIRGKEPMSWFEDYIFWAQRKDSFPRFSDDRDEHLLALPFQSLLHLTCGEWLTFADYLCARLNQIDWGITKPSFFPDTDTLEQSMRKLHFWRRWVPQARDMLEGSIRQAFGFQYPIPKHRRVSKLYRNDYDIIMKRLVEYESRIDRLSTVVNSAISLGDARNTSNLTILALFFIPPSLVAALLSMNTDSLSGIHEAFKWWALASTAAVVILFGSAHLINKEVARPTKRDFSLKIPALKAPVRVRTNEKSQNGDAA
ncbi:hypothetical protein FDECE_6101 [Fusarium decemcellulare]|nr:hypothetical protein FDECE_6101 [Fusarium decemcellulare]